MPTVVCEKHGLRYDPATQPGCVLCRRESGNVAMAAPPAAAPRPTAPTAERTVIPALVVAFVLWLVCGFALFAAHRAVVSSVQAMIQQRREADVVSPVVRANEEQTRQVLEELERMNQPDEMPVADDTMPAADEAPPPPRPAPREERPID